MRQSSFVCESRERRGPGSPRRASSRVLLTAVVLCAALISTMLSASTSSARQVESSSPTSGPVDTTAWQQFVQSATDLGPSTAGRVNVVAELRVATRPTAVLAWGKRSGITVWWPKGQQWVSMQGSPSSFDLAFHVAVDDYVTKSGERFYATRTPATVPPALRGSLDSLGRISSYLRLRMAYVPAGGLTPAGLARAYDATPLIDKGFRGAGRTIVFFEIDGFSRSDLAEFASEYRLSPFDVTVVGGQAGPSVGESNMDIETAHSIAPDARLVYYNVAAVNSVAGWATAFTDVAIRYPGALWSLSLDACELGLSPTDVQVANQAVATAESSGTTVFASAGDAGGAECLNYGVPSVVSGEGVAFPAVLPNVTGVGGTSLSVTTKGYYLHETTWTSSVLSQGSGGGVSTLVPRPSWQVGPGVGGAQGGAQYREVPDVSADADPTTGTSFVTSGSAYMGGGTSLGPPIWVGLTALIDGYLASFHKAPIGFANPLLYQLAASLTLRPPPFHDIKVGGNDFHSATPGYDPVTGVGSPDTAVLAQDILKNSAS